MLPKRKSGEAKIAANNERIRKLAQRLSTLQEEERRHMARELHDQIGQNLAALSLNLNIIGAQANNELVAQRIAISQQLIEETTSGIRNVMAELRPSVLDDHGLAEALSWLAERFENRSMIPTKFSGELNLGILTGEQETAVFRIVQELLNNTLKHAKATAVDIDIHLEQGQVITIIRDNGMGFDSNEILSPDEDSGWGATIMEERAHAVGGDIEFESSTGQGTVARISMPVLTDSTD